MSFAHYELRSTDPTAARAFYAAVIGESILAPVLSITELPARARERGAPSHWLGQFAVGDLSRTALRAVELGGEALGPGVFRDPGGAVFGLRSGAPARVSAPIIWHHLHTTDVDRVRAFYRELVGLDESLVSIADTARRPGVHPHWMFQFEVADIARALSKVLELGGTTLGVTLLSGGDRIAACEDAQRAAFALRQR